MSVQIYLLARPALDLEEVALFLRHQKTNWRRSPESSEPEEIVEFAGRICYLSFGDRQSPRENDEYIRNLVTMEHESVLEHVSWTFLLTGVSRAFTHQLVRHRVGFAFSQLSQQYRDQAEAEFVQPPELARFPAALEAWQRGVAAATEAYRTISKVLHQIEKDPGQEIQKSELRRSIRSAARSVLPNATETKIVVTANARALRHFLRVRGSIPGDLEMRQVAAALLQSLHREAPALFFDFHIEKLADGTPIVVQHVVQDGLKVASA
jgi:thymidylate synthase (FAD)